MINKVILVGNVGADPEVRSLEGGSKVARLRIATTERIRNRQTQEMKEYTEWHTVTLWGNMADVADKYVRKGSQLYVEGRLQTREWTDKDGNKRFTTEIVGNEMKMLGRRPDAPAEGGGVYSGAASAHFGAGQPQQPAAAPMSSSDIAASAVDEADDLPF